MNIYIEDCDIDEEKIIKSLGENAYGDEDFSLFKCPDCSKIYLIDYEVETIFPDSNNLSSMKGGTDFRCVACGYNFSGKIIIGKKADAIFKVTKDRINKSGWKWILK